MLSYAELDAVLSAELDASGSGRYPVPYRIECFNYAIRRAATAIGWALAERKAPEEALRELNCTALFQTNSLSGVTLDDPTLGHVIWNVLAVICSAGVVGQAPTILALPPSISRCRSDLAWNKSGKPCVRISIEQMARTLVDKSGAMPGSEALASNPAMVDHAYCITGTNAGGGWAAGSELTVLPVSLNKSTIVAIHYLKAPTEFTSDTSQVEYPKSMKQQLVDWALSFAAVRQGDNTTLASESARDAASLFSLMVS